MIFGNPGSTELPLIAALQSERFRYVLGLHEGIVTAKADGVAQAACHPVVVNLHAAPGLGNALGMLYNAQKSGTPLVAAVATDTIAGFLKALHQALASREPTLIDVALDTAP